MLKLRSMSIHNQIVLLIVLMTYPTLGIIVWHAYEEYRRELISSPNSGFSVVLNNLMIEVGIFTIILFLILVLVTYISRKGVLDKIDSLRDATLRIAQGDLGINCSSADSRNELDQLECSLSEMAHQLRIADQALSESAHKYRELVENATSVILKWDTNGKILFYNEYAEKLFGYSSHEVIGRSVIGTIVPNTESSGRDLVEMIQNISRNPDGYANNENENICKNGERVWISWTNRALVDSDGNKLGILSVGLDITARKMIEQELCKSEERFRSFVENANDVVFALTPDGIFSYVSPRWKDVFGYDISETVGQPFIPFVHPDDVQGCFVFLQKVMETGEKQSGVEYRVRCKDGRFVWYTANGALIRDVEKNTVTFIGIGRDITERKKTEETLRQSEEKFSAAFRASPDAITLSCLSDGICLEVNEGFTSLTGYLPKETVGKSFKELGLWDNPLERTEFIHLLDSTGMVNEMEVNFRRKDGTLFVGQISARTIEIDRMPCVLAITRDITEHEHIQQEIIKAQKLESISALAGGIAHNFNNVLTGVIGYISYAKKHLKDPDRVMPILDSAEKASYRAAGLARQLLTFSKGGIPIKKPVPVDSLVHESVSLFLTGTNVKSDITCETHQVVHVDSQQINQAFNNIILNAIHAMPEGGIMAVRINTVRLPSRNKYSLQQGNYVEIVFEDSGCGICKDDLPKVYDPYFTTKDNGTGLGLSTTHSIIHKHNGHIDIASDVGKGTTVTILLPSTDEVPVDCSEASELKIENLSEISVLFMDDDEMIRDIAETLLHEQGYDVTTCCDGEEAVFQYSTHMEIGKTFSVVILDMMIPGGIGGVEVARRILRIDPHANLLVSSGYTDNPVIAEYARYGFRGSLIKPYNAEQLVQAITTVCMSRPV